MKAMIIFLVIFKIVIAENSADKACGVVPISEWGRSESFRKEKLQTPVNLVVIQHTVSHSCISDAACENNLKNIRRYQINEGFDDVGMSFFIGGNGKVYEGAGWRVGAHTRRYNNRSISLSFIGDFRQNLPTSQALKAAQDFLSCVVANNNLREDYRLVGHRQLSATVSPGDALQTVIQTWPHWLEDTAKLAT